MKNISEFSYLSNLCLGHDQEIADGHVHTEEQGRGQDLVATETPGMSENCSKSYEIRFNEQIKVKILYVR